MNTRQKRIVADKQRTGAVEEAAGAAAHRKARFVRLKLCVLHALRAPVFWRGFVVRDFLVRRSRFRGH
jgi:hypothetical protein